METSKNRLASAEFENKFPAILLSVVLLFAPFYDILRLLYFNKFTITGFFHELVLSILIVMILTNRKTFMKRRLDLIDYFLFVYVFGGLVQVFQSPSILGGLYVWRWYSVGPLTYFVLRWISFNQREINLIFRSTILGLVLAAFVLLYQYFVIGPDATAQWMKTVGYYVMYRYGWRLSSVFASPLTASACLSILLLVGIAGFVENKLFWLNFTFVMLGIVTPFLTLSRSGWAIGLIGSFFILLEKYGRQFLFWLVLLLPVSVLFISSNSVISNSLATIIEYSNDPLDQYRFEKFAQILQEGIEYPFGRGFGGGGAVALLAYNLFGGNAEMMVPLNSLSGDSVFLAALQTSGWIGFASIIGFVITILVFTHRIIKKIHHENRVYYLVVFGLYIGVWFTFGNLIDVWPMKIYIWVFGALIVNVYKNMPHKVNR